jgi:hypothetical protein
LILYGIFIMPTNLLREGIALPGVIQPALKGAQVIRFKHGSGFGRLIARTVKMKRTPRYAGVIAIRAQQFEPGLVFF